MAYMNQEHKKEIAAALKLIIPATWKWSLAVRHHSTIVLTISAAPVDLLGEIERCAKTYAEQRGKACHFNKSQGIAVINVYHPHNSFDKHLDLITKIIAALNLHNFDKSDPMTDYFHVGHYVALQVGRWDKPFIFTGEGAQ